MPSKRYPIEHNLIITISEDQQPDTTFRLTELQGLISRGRIRQAILPDQTVSAPHVILDIRHIYGEDQIDQIRDLGSANGTWQNGKKIPSTRWSELKDGDRLTFGLVEAQYVQATRQLIFADSAYQPISNLRGRVMLTRRLLPLVDYKFTDTAVSAPHLLIKILEGSIQARDLSINGAFLRGKPIEKRGLLFNNDELQIGYKTSIKILTDLNGIPRKINNWERLEWAGGGGMAYVYKVRHALDKTIRAMKIPRPDQIHHPEEGQFFQSLFQNEIALAQKIHHQNIVEAYEMDEIPNADGLPYLVMAYVDGPSLSDLIKGLGQIPIPELVEIVRQVGQALTYLHIQHQYVHCDLKPNNILIDSKGKLYLTDLGVATPIGDRFTGLGVRPFTPEEIIGGGMVGPDTDIYALGHIIQQMVDSSIDESQLEDKSNQTSAIVSPALSKPVVTALTEALPEQHHPLIHIIQKCKHKRREERYQEISALFADLAYFESPPDLKDLVSRFLKNR